jgi:L-fuconate dehydratase
MFIEAFEETMVATRITGSELFDVRFPTSTMLDGSDAMNQDPDYSAAYITINTSTGGLAGNSLVFTTGRGNDLQIEAIRILTDRLNGLDIDDAFTNIGEIAKQLSRDSHIRWLGPDVGVFHMAAGAILNALWDLFAKARNVPLWKLLSDLTPEQVVAAIDFRYITDVLTPQQALEILKKAEPNKKNNEEILRSRGVPAYTTSPGWLGYSDEKMLALTKTALDDGFRLIKYKCGSSIVDDRRRLTLIREMVGPDFKISIDANQVWDVDQAIDWLSELKEFDLHWIEEPTHPEDVLGHSRIAREVAPLKVATGEMANNRVIFKQLLQADAISIMQIDSARVAGVNENLANILMAAKFNIPVCPHAGGVGLCEMVQHLAMFDAVAVSGHHDRRVVEFVDHLHEHFVTPVEIKAGHYVAPLSPGGGGEMFPESVQEFLFPNGKYWSTRK